MYHNEIELEVRDYECDLQGIVNNANYQHYLEHARHKWLQTLGLDFAALHAMGIDLIVVRAEVDYKTPLRSRDRFLIRSTFEREGRLKLICIQDIYRVPDEKLVLKARITAAALKAGRPAAPPEVFDKIEQVLGGA